jgi:hypothetical protein
MANAPESINWYIDVIKWILGIAAGMLVFAFDKMKPDGWPTWMEIAYFGSAAVLALAVLFGVLAIWQWLPYASRIEMGEKPTDDKPKKLVSRGTTFYTIMASAFLAGILAFAVVLGASQIRAKPAAAAELKLIPAGTPTSFLVVRQAAGGSAMQVLSQESPGTFTWKNVEWPASP